jgi:hypothetical protein
MINKFIIPFLIIIFSLLIIYYILNKRNKKYFIEKFIPIIVKNSSDQIIDSNENNIVESNLKLKIKKPVKVVRPFGTRGRKLSSSFCGKSNGQK